MSRFKIPSLIILLTLVTGCISIDVDGLPLCSGDTWSKATLYLGRDMAGTNMDGTEKDGTRVSDEDLATFIERHVTPQFPDGFTVAHARGMWRSEETGEQVHEDTVMLIILHQNSEADRSGVRDIARDWRARFNQESVLVSREHACVDFVGS